jgi:DNA-binding MarR family transcriptional regulator
LSEPGHEAAARLQTLATRLLRLARRREGEGGIGSAQYSAMAALHAESPLPLVELARRERVSHPTMSRVVAALVRQGLVARIADERDRRSRFLALTGEGRAVYERISGRRIAVTAAILSLLKPESVADVIAAVETVAARLEAD